MSSPDDPTSPSVCCIDGSVLEGGGQILRQSTALAGLFGRPLRIEKIRAGRKKPGVKAQHLVGIQLVARQCSATTSGDVKDSCELHFTPTKPVQGGSYVGDIGTAGSVQLLVQSILPGALYASCSSTFTLHGGTNASWAPMSDYTQRRCGWV
jgi:RNA 3'-terminal phosphate cyclase (ATP)